MFTSGARLQVASRFSLSALEDGRWTAVRSVALSCDVMGEVVARQHRPTASVPRAASTWIRSSWERRALVIQPAVRQTVITRILI